MKTNNEGNMKIRTTFLTITAASLMVLSGCATTTEETDVMDSGSSDTSEFDQGEVPAEEVVREVVDTALSLGTAYFDYNKSEIRGDMRDVLKVNAEVLKGSNQTAMIAGHTDERGSAEYNLALGERRAQTVRKYLEALGVPNSQMRIKSYGESRPAVKGHDESAWGLNRRAELSSN